MILRLDDGGSRKIGWYHAAAGMMRISPELTQKLVCHRCAYELSTIPHRRVGPPPVEDAALPSADDSIFQVDRPLVANEAPAISVVDAATGEQLHAGAIQLLDGE